MKYQIIKNDVEIHNGDNKDAFVLAFATEYQKAIEARADFTLLLNDFEAGDFQRYTLTSGKIEAVYTCGRDMVAAVRDFQSRVLGRDFAASPSMLQGDKLEHTISCLKEEADELIEAKTIADQADALVDSVYFALGALDQMGVDTIRVFNEVHRANMLKVPGFTKRNIPGDAKKPEGWVAPDHSWLDAVGEAA